MQAAGLKLMQRIKTECDENPPPHIVDVVLAAAKGREDKILKMMEEQIGTMRLISDQRDVKPAGEGRGLWARLFG